MKGIFQISICCLTSFFILGCTDSNNQEKEETPTHEDHNALNNNFAHEDIIVLENPYHVNDTIRQQFDLVLNAYLEMSEALYNEAIPKVDLKIDQMKENIGKISSANFHGEAVDAWEQHASLYDKKLKEMKHIEGINNKRSYFSHLSEILYCTIKSFQFNKHPIYSVYCKKAFKNAGAYWITNSKILHNPYLGKNEQDCGVIKEEL